MNYNKLSVHSLLHSFTLQNCSTATQCVLVAGAIQLVDLIVNTFLLLPFMIWKNQDT
jgi:hypothetical protein